MKKRIISLVMALFIISLAVILTACYSPPQKLSNPESISAGISDLKKIEEKDLLFYDIDTKIVYYLFSTTFSNSTYEGYSYMSPYISENGNYCRYIDGKIVEIQ